MRTKRNKILNFLSEEAKGDEMRLGEHKDARTFTLLFTNGQPGLQVRENA